jgi:hypothetical protein
MVKNTPKFSAIPRISVLFLCGSSGCRVTGDFVISHLINVAKLIWHTATWWQNLAADLLGSCDADFFNFHHCQVQILNRYEWDQKFAVNFKNHQKWKQKLKKYNWIGQKQIFLLWNLIKFTVSLITIKYLLILEMNCLTL